jgi:excisionase family DNA binding protein
VLLFLFLLHLVQFAMSAPGRKADPRWASFKDAAAYAAIPPKTLRDWVSKGRVPAYRIGPRQLQLDLNDIDRMRRRVPTLHDDAKEKAVS